MYSRRSQNKSQQLLLDQCHLFIMSRLVIHKNGLSRIQHRLRDKTVMQEVIAPPDASRFGLVSLNTHAFLALTSQFLSLRWQDGSTSMQGYG